MYKVFQASIKFINGGGVVHETFFYKMQFYPLKVCVIFRKCCQSLFQRLKKSFKIIILFLRFIQKNKINCVFLVIEGFLKINEIKGCFNLIESLNEQGPSTF